MYISFFIGMQKNTFEVCLENVRSIAGLVIAMCIYMYYAFK